MRELQAILQTQSATLAPFADTISTIESLPQAIRDDADFRVLTEENYWNSVLDTSRKAWESLQTTTHLVSSEDHILAGPTIFDSEGYSRKDLFRRVNSHLILAAANLRSWLSDPETRQELIDLVKIRRKRVTLILATYETLRPISAEGAAHLRQSVEDIEAMLRQLTREERNLMKTYFHIAATTLSAVFIDPELPNGILFFNPRWAIQFLPQDRLTCVIDKTINSPDLYKAIYNSVLLMTQRDAKSVNDMLPGKTVFVSYRRSDSADITGRLTDKLIDRFGSEAIFKDVDSIISGHDFKGQIDHAVQKCNVFVAVIGRNWFGPRARNKAFRLENPDDFVRLEVEAALSSGIPVIPVLVHGASMPEAHTLPDSLHALAQKQAIFLQGDPNFHKDLGRLIRDIETHFKSSSFESEQAR